MKKIISFISCIAITVIANAQSPSFQWAGSIGGPANDAGFKMATDASGNVYTIGFFYGTADFDPGPATFNLTSAGSDDVFISKVDAFGNFVWAKRFGGFFADIGTSMAIDASGNIYAAGTFGDTVDFDPGLGVANLISSGASDIFVSKLDASGNFLWAENLGGASLDYVRALALDSSDNVYMTGFFQGPSDFDPGAATFNLNSSSASGDIFISKLDSSGNFIWAKDIAGTLMSRSNSITTDASGNVYTTGYFKGTSDFDPGAADTVNVTSSGNSDAFILKLDASGNFVWVKNMGGSSDDISYSVNVDSSGNVYSTGIFQLTADLDPGPGINDLTVVGGYDMFILKLDVSGNFLWAKQIEGIGGEFPQSMTIDASGNIYTTGFFTDSADFDPGPGSHILTSNGNGDIFICKLDASGNFIWVEHMGGTVSDLGVSIEVDASGNVYTMGYYGGTVDFDPTAATLNLTSSLGSLDVFINKMSQNITTSVATENAGTDNISIYPNPTNNVLNVVLPKSVNNPSVEIYNGIGALVYNKQTTGETTTIDLTDQAKGIYFIKVLSDHEIITTQKIIRQ